MNNYFIAKPCLLTFIVYLQLLCLALLTKTLCSITPC